MTTWSVRYHPSSGDEFGADGLTETLAVQLFEELVLKAKKGGGEVVLFHGSKVVSSFSKEASEPES